MRGRLVSQPLRFGYDGPMTEPGTGQRGDDSSDDDQLISDDKLPEDLQPDKNPLARDPDDPRNQTEDDQDSAGPSAGGMPDMGQPG